MNAIVRGYLCATVAAFPLFCIDYAQGGDNGATFAWGIVFAVCIGGFAALEVATRPKR